MSQDQSTFPTNQYFPYWKKLPYLVQREVGLMLSFFERKTLATCSIATGIFVSGLPIYRFQSLKFCFKYGVFSVELKDSRGTTECTFSIFYENYKNSSCFFEKVEFPKGWEQNHVLVHLFSYRRIPFRCNTFVWHVDGLGTLPDMLDWIDKETIKTIFLHDTFCPRTHTEIKNNMTWKQAEHLYIEFSNENPGTQEIALQNTNIDWIDLSRFKNLELNITGISAKDAWKLIKAYKTCEHPRGSCIIVKSRSAIHSKRLMALFDVEVNNQPISNIPAVHTQQFSKSDQRLVLVVMIHPKHFEGIVCGVDTIKEDVQSATGGVFSKKSN